MIKQNQKPTNRSRPKQIQHKKEVSAGGIVFKRMRDRILIGFILDPYKKWIFAKGHVEKKDKSIKDAAIRETREEMGLKYIRVKAPLGQIAYTFTLKRNRIHKVVHYFLMETRPEEKGAPQKEEKIKMVRWVGIRTAKKLLGYKNTMIILDRAIEWLKKNPVHPGDEE